MTDLLLFLIMWFGSGIAGWYLSRYMWTKEFDWTVADAILFGFMALFGPVFLVASTVISFVNYIPSLINTERVLKEKRK